MPVYEREPVMPTQPQNSRRLLLLLAAKTFRTLVAGIFPYDQWFPAHYSQNCSYSDQPVNKPKENFSQFFFCVHTAKTK